MKKVLYLLFIVPIIVFSCKKDHLASTSVSSGKKYKVTFDVTNFMQTQKTFAVRHNAIGLASDTLSTLNGYLDVLYYVLIWDHQDYQHQPVMQDSTMANMGTFTDSIPAGTYQVAFFGGKKGLTYSSYFGPTASYGYGGAPWQDTFWNTFTLTVADGNPNITQEITLKRVVGKLEVKLLDNIPATADSLFITIHNESNAKSMNQNSDYSEPLELLTFLVAIPASAKGHPNFTVDRIIGNTTSPGSITITCKDVSGHLIASTTADNVKCNQNQKTILSGKLFQSDGQAQTFTTKVDSTWGPTQHLGF